MKNAAIGWLLVLLLAGIGAIHKDLVRIANALECAAEAP